MWGGIEEKGDWDYPGTVGRARSPAEASLSLVQRGARLWVRPQSGQPCLPCSEGHHPPHHQMPL